METWFLLTTGLHGGSHFPPWTPCPRNGLEWCSRSFHLFQSFWDAVSGDDHFHTITGINKIFVWHVVFLVLCSFYLTAKVRMLWHPVVWIASSQCKSEETWEIIIVQLANPGLYGKGLLEKCMCLSDWFKEFCCFTHIIMFAVCTVYVHFIFLRVHSVSKIWRSDLINVCVINYCAVQALMCHQTWISG